MFVFNHFICILNYSSTAVTLSFFKFETPFNFKFFFANHKFFLNKIDRLKTTSEAA